MEYIQKIKWLNSASITHSRPFQREVNRGMLSPPHNFEPYILDIDPRNPRRYDLQLESARWEEYFAVGYVCFDYRADKTTKKAWINADYV